MYVGLSGWQGTVSRKNNLLAAALVPTVIPQMIELFFPDLAKAAGTWRGAVSFYFNEVWPNINGF